jgi:hypothetical protein
VRKRIETTFNQIVDYFAKRIYSITPRGVELNEFLAILSCSIYGWVASRVMLANILADMSDSKMPFIPLGCGQDRELFLV